MLAGTTWSGVMGTAPYELLEQPLESKPKLPSHLAP